MNTSRIKLLSSLFLILGALTLIARADVLAKYSFPVTNDASANPVVANMTATSAARTGTLGIWEVGSSLYTYASSPVLRVAPGTGATSASTAVANNSYFSFTLTPNSAYVLICTNLSFNIARGGGTYPNRGYVVRSSLDSYAADLSASPVTTVRPTWTNIFINLGSSFSNLQSTLTFRIYIFAEGTGSSLELDDITVSGSAVLVAPSGLTVGITNYQAWLTWASAPGSTNYVVLRSTTSGGPYTRIATNAATSFTESGLAHGTTYYYVVLGQSNLGETPNSNQGSGTTAPDAPVVLYALPGDGRVTLSWPTSSGATSYVVKRFLTGTGYVPIATNATTSYVDTSVVNGTTYFYVVAARTSGGDSAGTTPDTSATPNVAPANFVAVSSLGQVALTWNSLASATSYNIKRAFTSGGPYSLYAIGVTAPNYLDTGVTNGAVYYYVVSGQLPGGESAYSLEAGAVVPLGTPSGLSATNPSFSTIALSWTSGGAGATGYKIERGSDGVSFAQVGTSVGTSYADTTMPSGVTNYYRVRAYTAYTNSDYSGIASAKSYTRVIAVNFTATSMTTNFPGYVNDYGLIYGLRTNGYTYGWDVDNSAAARERSNAGSPDKRYDTLIHMQNTGVNHFWELAVSNGVYTVWLVAGDPTAVNSVYQFTLDNTITPAVTPAAPNYWASFTNTATVTDGRLTLYPFGPLANNNKIAFLEVYYMNVPAAVLAGPLDLTLPERTATNLSVIVTGAPPMGIQWYFNTNTLLVGQTNATLNFASLMPSNSGIYSAVVTNTLSVVTSRFANLTVVADTTPPSLVAVTPDLANNQVRVVFSELVSTTTATNLANYALDGGVTITNASLFGNYVILYTTTLTPGNRYTLITSNVTDIAVTGPWVMSPNPVTNQFVAWSALTNGVVRREWFTNLATGNNSGVNSLLAHPKFISNLPDVVDYLTSFNSAQTLPTPNGMEDYGLRLSGYLIPPVSGSYFFRIYSDDESRFFLSPDENPLNRQLLMRYNDGICCGNQAGFPAGITSAPVSLVAGRLYYMEALLKEGGGGDGVRVDWMTPGSSSFVTIPGTNTAFEVRMDQISAITQQLTNIVVNEGVPAVFNFGLNTPDQGTTYQWQSNLVNLLTTSNGNFTISFPTPAMNASYRCIATTRLDTGPLAGGFTNVLTSDTATLTVIPDLTAPTILSAYADAMLSNVRLTFSERVLPASAGNPANYAMSGGVSLWNVLVSTNGSNVVLLTTAQTPGAAYYVTNNGVADLATSTNMATSFIQAQTLLLQQGYVREQIFTNVAGGSSVTNLTNALAYQLDQPSLTIYTNFFGWNRDATGARGNYAENYGLRAQAYFVPPSNGVYNFFISSDDNAELYMNTNSAVSTDPAGLTLIIAKAGSDLAYSAFSTNITLNAGQFYLMQFLLKENTGADALSLTFRAAPVGGTPTTTAPPNSEVALGWLFYTLVDPALSASATVNITLNPQPSLTNLLSVSLATVALTAQAVGSPLPADVIYQWQQADGIGGFTNIPFAFASNYTTVPISVDTSYRVVASSFGAFATSTVAVIQAMPTPIGLSTTGGTNQISLSWTASAHATNYVVSRSSALAGPYTLLETNNATTFLDTGLGDGVTLYYVVAAQGNAGQTPNSAPAGAATTPPTPADLAVINGDSLVTLGWTAAPGATGYVVSVSTTTGGPYTPTLTNAAIGCIVPGLGNGSTYYFVVSAVNSAGASAPSAEAVGQPNVAPLGLAAVGGTNIVTLSWTALDGALSYNLKRSLSLGGPYATIQTGVPSTPTSYADTTVAGGTIYYYIVSAQLTGGESANSSPASALSAPSAPALTATLLNGTNVNLAWTSGNAPALTTYLIERCTDNYSFGRLANVAGATTSFLDQNIYQEVIYYYRIRGTNSTGFGPYSVVASAGSSLGAYSFAKVNFGSGPLGQGGSMTNYPGYLPDIGEVYALRTNGYTYGWDADNQANARWRLQAGAPALFPGGVYDYLLDTLTHLDKQVPSRIWEIAVPVGMYRVHVVGGDPTAQNTVLQYSIEGTNTAAHDCTVENIHFSDYSNLVVMVTDGRLTVTSGAQATNNKICYVEIDSMGRPDLAIGTQPQSQTVTENQPAAFAVVVTNGVAPITYQWFYNGSPIANATNASFSIPMAQLTDAGDYWVGISNFVGSITSLVATLTVDEDFGGPQVVSVGSLNGWKIGIVFDEIISNYLGVATTPANYQVNGGENGVASVELRPDGRTVVLNMADRVFSTFTVEADWQYDLKLNQTEASVQSGTVMQPGALNQDFGPLGIVGYTTNADLTVTTNYDIVDPLYLGSTFVADSDHIEVLAGGSDIGSTNDAAHFVYVRMTNDFAAKVRVDSLRNSNPYAKAGLLARSSFAANDQDLGVFVTPAVATGGAGVCQTLARPAAASNSVVLSQANLLSPAANWVKLLRMGNSFFTFYSADGITWVPFATNTPTLPYPSVLYVGLATTAHTNTASDHTVATYGSFEAIPPLTITTQPEPASVTLDIRTSVTFSNLTVNSSLPVTYQWRRNGAVLANATNADLTLTNLAVADSGLYVVAIANSIGTVLSIPCNLTVTNGLPVLVVPDLLTVTQNVARVFAATNLLSGDSDPEGDPLSVLAVYGSSVTFTSDFNSGLLPTGTALNGVAIVDTTGGVTNSGVLKLTTAGAGQNGWFNISNLAPGRLVSAFTANFKLLLTSGSLPPADGFSFNFTPTLPAGTWPAPPFVGAGQEEGLPPGLSVCFDTYNNGATEQPPEGAPAIDIRWNGAQIGHVMMPEFTNANWIQVGITLNGNGTLDVSFAGTNVYQGFPTGFVPMEGGFVLAARTGGAFETHYVDDLSITAWTSQTAAGGDARLSGGQVTYTPPVNACGSDTFYYLASDLAGGTRLGTVAVTIECFQVSGHVEMESYAGPAHNGNGTRVVTFTATDGLGSPVAAWSGPLDFVGGVAPYTLTNFPANAVNLGAKTAWSLRKRLPVTFGGYTATVNFTWPNLLLGGDIDGSNMVDIQDYFKLAAAWYSNSPQALESDIDGSGLVDLDDYFLLGNHWYLPGDAP